MVDPPLSIALFFPDEPPWQDASKKWQAYLNNLDIQTKETFQGRLLANQPKQRYDALAEIAKADDFIVSDELTGLLLTQISENKQLGAVFEDLFDSDGAEIYLKPAGDYVTLDKSVNFYTVCESGIRRNETVIGYRLLKDANDAGKSYGVRVNPLKSENITFTVDDKVIVLADS